MPARPPCAVVFDAYDEEGTGLLGERQVENMQTDINSDAHAFKANLKGAMTAYDANKDGAIDFWEFQEVRGGVGQCARVGGSGVVGGGL